METRQYNVYKYDELTKQQKEKVLERYYDINVQYGDWHESTYEDAKNIGLKIAEFDIDHNTIDGNFEWDALEVANEIIENHGKECETTKTALKYLPELKRENDENDSDSRDNTEHEFLHDLLEDYLIMLRHEFEYLTSKEVIEETIRANDYSFTDDGKID